MAVDNKSLIFKVYKVYILKTASTGSGKCFNKLGQFLAWAWLAKAKGHSCHTKKINPCQNIYGKKPSKSAKYHRPLRYEKKTG